MGKITWLVLVFLVPLSPAEVVINEIHYDPPDQNFQAGALREFIEILNPGPASIELSGYRFTRGITYTFPPGTVLNSQEFLILARDPTHSTWLNAMVPVFGPYEGNLSNEGERLRLERPDGSTVEDFTYDDAQPWPNGADGYGASLERIDPTFPAHDFHSWRGSLNSGGTPGLTNSVVNTPPYPLILNHRVIPEHPQSTDMIRIQVTLDAVEIIQEVTLQYQIRNIKAGSYGSTTKYALPMQEVRRDLQQITYEATMPTFPSQSLVRYNLKIRLPDNQTLLLPHRSEKPPYKSFFVYNGELNSLLPILWKFTRQSTTLTEPTSTVSGVVIKDPSDTYPVNYDGADVGASRNGEKIHFLKEQVYHGNRTLNLIPERPPEGLTAGITAPHREDLAFWFFNQHGVLAPRADWLRVVVPPASGKPTQTQQLGIEQINEDFLTRNGKSLDAYLFKRNYVDPKWEPHLNEELGSLEITKLEGAIATSNSETRRRIIEDNLNNDDFLAYSIVSMLLTNWDGYHNNHWMYKVFGSGALWEIFPWDQDKAWGYTDTVHFYTEFPLTYPVTATSSGVSRSPGPILAPLHKDTTFYTQFLYCLRAELDKTFTEEFIYPKVEELRTLLLADLQLLETSLGTTRNERRSQIHEAYNIIRAYIPQRKQYLLSQLAAYDPTRFPPLLLREFFVRGDAILLTFDKALEKTSAGTTGNYQIFPVDSGFRRNDGGFGLITPASASLVSANQVLITFPVRLDPDMPYKVNSEGILDASYGNPSTFQQRILTYTEPSVSISEIMYNNRGEDLEWIELHNTTQYPQDISGWLLTDDETYPPQGEGMVLFPPGTILDPDEYVVVNLWANPLISQWQFPPNVRILTPLVQQVGALANGGDNLALYNKEKGGGLIDGSLSVVFPDLTSDGESLEKIDPDFAYGRIETLPYLFRKAAVPLGFTTGISSSGRPLSDKGSPGRDNGSAPPLGIENWGLY